VKKWFQVVGVMPVVGDEAAVVASVVAVAVAAVALPEQLKVCNTAQCYQLPYFPGKTHSCLLLLFLHQVGA